MKLLFDENLSPKLVRLLSDLFPDSVHVRDVGLKAADDPIVWKYAQDNGLMICSKDSDMHQRSFVLGLLRKLSGCDWAIALPTMWQGCCEDTPSRSKHSTQTIMRRF